MCKINVQPHNIACFASLVCFSTSLVFLYIFIFHNNNKHSYYIEVSIYALLLCFILYVIRTNIKKEYKKGNRKGNTKIHPSNQINRI